MICSVYDSARRIYTYYECPGPARAHGVTGTKFRAPNRPPEMSPSLGANATIGFTPDALALVLPPGATPIGTGTRPRGVIAVTAGGNPLKAFMADKGGSGPALRGALAGLGEAPTVLPTNPPTQIEVKSNLAQVVFAACVASVVGVMVQKALR